MRAFDLTTNASGLSLHTQMIANLRWVQKRKLVILHLILGCRRPTLDRYRVGSFTHTFLIAAFVNYRSSWSSRVSQRVWVSNF